MERAFQDTGLTILSEGPVLVLLWRQSPNIERAQQLERAASRLLQGHPGGIAIVVVALRTMGLPPAELRQPLTDFLRRISPSVRAISILSAGNSLQLSLLRSFLTAVFILIRPSFKPRWCSSPREAVAHACEATGRVDLASFTEISRAISEALV